MKALVKRETDVPGMADKVLRTEYNRPALVEQYRYKKWPKLDSQDVFETVFYFRDNFTH